MPVKADGRRRTDLELFVLALIGEGVSTAYELMIHAELSPGATLPVLRRLQADGFVRPTKVQARKRASFELTISGRRWLRSGWKDLVGEEPRGSLDTILRAALLAATVGGDPHVAQAFLRQAARIRQAVPGCPGKPEIGSNSLAATYRTLRASMSHELRSAEGRALAHLADRITSRKAGRLRIEAALKRTKRSFRPS